MEEVWKEIEGYEGRCFISNFGKVKKISFNNTNKEKLYKLRSNQQGYLLAHLSKNNKSIKILVHRLVAKAFVKNPLNKKCVNHIDGNVKNNHFSNLEWATHSENLQHAYDNNLAKKGERHCHAKLTQKDVDFIRKFHKTKFTALELSEKFNITRRNIYDIVNNKSWKVTK